jgi:AcrR family transcriptional regulator
VAAELSSFVTAAITLRPHRPPPFPQVTEPMANSSPQPRTGRRAWGSAPGELLAAAAELFSQKGYAATSTKEIAQRCGIAESLLFFHFPTKEDLFTRAVFEPFLHAVESLTGGWDRHAWQAHAIEQTTRTFIATLYHWMTADRALLLGMIHSSILTDAAGPSFAQAQTGLRLLFDRIETEHVKAREFHDLPPVDIPLTIRSTFAALLAVTVLDQLFLGTTPTPPTQDRVVAELLDYLTAATVRTIPPRSEQ